MRRSSILNQHRSVCSNVVNEFTAKLNKSFKSFIKESLLLYRVIPRKINILQMGRYSDSIEQRLRQVFARDFEGRVSFALDGIKENIHPVIQYFVADAFFSKKTLFLNRYYNVSQRTYRVCRYCRITLFNIYSSFAS